MYKRYKKRSTKKIIINKKNKIYPLINILKILKLSLYLL